MMPHEEEHWQVPDEQAARLPYPPNWSPPSTRRHLFRRPDYDYYQPPPPMHYRPPSWSDPWGHHYEQAPPPPPPPEPYTPYHMYHTTHAVTPQDSTRPSVVHLPSCSAPSKPELIYEVRDSDVLCGRGAPTSWHHGNQYFRRLVSKHQSAYLASRRADKPEIATMIVDKVRERGGRFLKRTKMPGVGPSGHFCWQEIGEQRSYEKACQALREGAPEIRRRMLSAEADRERRVALIPASKSQDQDETIKEEEASV